MVCLNNLLVFYRFATLFMLQYYWPNYDEWHEFYDDFKKKRLFGEGYYYLHTCFKWKSVKIYIHCNAHLQSCYGFFLFCFVLIFKEVSSKCGKFGDTVCSINRSYFSHLYFLTIYISDSYTNCFLMFFKKKH